MILTSQLVSAAEAIEKLSAAAAAGQDTLDDFTDPVPFHHQHHLHLHHHYHCDYHHHHHHHCCFKVRDISDSAVRKTVEENQDLRRQVLLPFYIFITFIIVIITIVIIIIVILVIVIVILF